MTPEADDMTGRHDDHDDDTSGWSLLYAPESPLAPIACAGCGNVFAADAAACPWCGRSLAAPARATVPARSLDQPPAGLMADGEHDDARIVDSVFAPPSRAQQTRRWAGVMVAGGVLLAIATGVAVRSDDDSGTSAPTTRATSNTTVARSATTASATTVAGNATPSTATDTAPVTTVANAAAPPPTETSAPAPTTVTPAPTTAAPVATTAAGPSLSDPERRAVAVTQQLSDAIVAHDWNRVRALAPRNSTTDEAYDRYWGTIERATLVPARVTANPDGTYVVYTGVVNVTNPASGRVSTVACGRYTVDLAAGAVIAVQSKDMRTTAGVLDVATVADELRTTCKDSPV